MVKRGELTAFVEENGIFSKKTSRQQVYFFLFNDVLILTRKKSEDSYVSRLCSEGPKFGWTLPGRGCQPITHQKHPLESDITQPGASHLFRLRFRSNHSGDKVPMSWGWS
ncbi:rho guanine nucleotide exchange factor 26 isoform X1 [Salvelinus sp. IW2-2015]|uniref:rho guanine nucleotide exchange factor 26 isoform X1 n=1 Tax=Salvelinus sp. IW2-2015 TaxID=2691554 RepID=UPI0038D506F8